MMNILEEILANKRREVKEQSELYPVKLLERSPYFKAQPVSLAKYLQRKELCGVIAEFKRKSPSKGVINEYADPAEVCLEYMQAGASALSVITDSNYFAGRNQDLVTARKFNYCPILRKDFIVDKYQLTEARSIGADAILLIAEVLNKGELEDLFRFATDLGLEVLFEVHDPESLDKLPADAQMVGINNRNLKNFEVNVEKSLELVSQLPPGVLKIAESGIDSPQTAAMLLNKGFSGLLMGERFMREASPGTACKLFISELKKQKNHS